MSGSRISFQTGQGGLAKLRVETVASTAEVYLHGAHITYFQRQDEQPILFLSKQAVFAPGKAIRGGVPVILPWFGPRDGMPAHGFARTRPWELLEVASTRDECARLRFRLPDFPAAAEWPRFVAEYEVLVGDTLELELQVSNLDPKRPLPLESCLHTYFAVSDIRQIEVNGLKGARYLDALDNFAQKTETEAAIAFSGEVDRVYLDAPQTVSIVDPGYERVIEVAKSDSLSTVVWNPWIEKATRLADFADDEYLRMLCVESGNVKQNQIFLDPGRTAAFSVVINSHAL